MKSQLQLRKLIVEREMCYSDENLGPRGQIIIDSLTYAGHT